MFFNQRLCKKIWPCHTHTNIFCFITAGYDTAIIVTEHHNGFGIQGGPEQSLAGAIKTVTIYNGFHDLFKVQDYITLTTHVTTPHTLKSLSSPISILESFGASAARKSLLNVFS